MGKSHKKVEALNGEKGRRRPARRETASTNGSSIYNGDRNHGSEVSIGSADLPPGLTFGGEASGSADGTLRYARSSARSTEVSPLRDRETEDEPTPVVLGCVGWFFGRDGTAASFIVRVGEPSA